MMHQDNLYISASEEGEAVKRLCDFDMSDKNLDGIQKALFGEAFASPARSRHLHISLTSPTG